MLAFFQLTLIEAGYDSMHDANKEAPFVKGDGVKSGDGSLLSHKKGGRGLRWALWADARCCALGCFASALRWFGKLNKNVFIILFRFGK